MGSAASDEWERCCDRCYRTGHYSRSMLDRRFRNSVRHPGVRRCNRFGKQSYQSQRRQFWTPADYSRHQELRTTPYIGVFSYLYNSSGSITLNGQWPGDTGSFTYVIENTGYPTTLGSSQADHTNLQMPWACTWNSSSQVTLDRPWTGTSGVYNLYQSPGRPSGGYAIGGYGQQPYMLGIAVTGISYASQVGDGAYDALWKTLAQNAATWLWTSGNGYDPYSQGVNYGAIYGGCDQKVPVSTTVGFILGTAEGNGDWCQVDSLPNGGINTARGIAAETLGSLTQYYQSNPGPTLKAFGDTVYGSIFASRAYTTGGVYTPSDNNPGSNQYFAAYKWPGFYFGM